jgi:O-antigen ligase
MSTIPERLSNPPRPDLRWLFGVGGLVVLITGAYVLLAYAASPLLLPVALAALAVVYFVIARPALGLALAFALLPSEAISFNTGIGALSPPEAILLLVGAGYVVRTLIRPETVSLPGLRDVPILLFLSIVALGVVPAFQSTVVVRVFIIWLGFFAAHMQARSFTPKQIRLVLTGLAIGVAIIGVIGAARYLASGQFGVTQGGNSTVERAVGSLGDPNYYAAMLVLGLLPACALVLGDFRERWWLSIPILGTMLGLVLSLSRGGISGFAVGLLFLLTWQRARWFALAVLTLFIALTAFNANPIVKSDQFGIVKQRLSTLTSSKTESETDRRPQIWGVAATVAVEHPFLGVGINQFEFQSQRRDLFESGEPLENAHSIPLDLAAETGLIGLTAFFVFLGQLIARALVAMRSKEELPFTLAIGLGAALVAFALQGLTVVQMRVEIITGAFFVLGGMVTALADRQRRLQQEADAEVSR